MTKKTWIRIFKCTLDVFFFLPGGRTYFYFSFVIVWQYFAGWYLHGCDCYFFTREYPRDLRAFFDIVISLLFYFKYERSYPYYHVISCFASEALADKDDLIGKIYYLCCTRISLYQ